MILNEYFSKLGDTLASADIQAIGQFYSIPSIVIKGEKTSICNSTEELESYWQTQLEELTRQGVRRLRAQILKQMRLADEIFFANVEWECLDQQGTALYRYPTSYTVRLPQGQSPKIVASVFDSTDFAGE